MAPVANSLLRVSFNEYVKEATKKYSKNGKKFSKLPTDVEYQKLSPKLGCEFASSKVVGGYISFLKKNKGKIWTDVKSRK